MTGRSVRSSVLARVLSDAWHACVQDCRWQRAWIHTDSGNYSVTYMLSALQTAPGMSGSSMADATERPTLVPETYPALEHEVYLSLEPRTERPTEPAPFDLDALAEAV